MSKSIGSENTLDRDVSEKADIKFHMRRSADVIGRRLRKKNYVAFGVGLKLKTANFQLVSRRHRLGEPTDVAERLYSVAVDLLENVDHTGPFRLIGLVAYDLVCNADLAQADLFNTLGRRRQLEVAIDRLAERFGINIVQRAGDLDQPAELRLAATLDHLEDES
jgi:DNA polymerase IV